jgi:diacylglycerol kinase (ATP)
MQFSRNFLLVVNPISGDINKAEVVKAARNLAHENQIQLHLLKTDGKNDQDRLAEEYLQINPERVLIAGGDGTIKLAAEALKSHNPIFGLIPAGSANGLSVDLDLPTDLESVLQIAFFGNPSRVDMVCINDRISIHLSDIGLNAALVKNYEQGSIRGKLGYMIQGFTTLSEQYEPFDVHVESHEVSIKTSARMVVIANSQKYGTGVVINPMGDVSDGKFEIVVLKSMDILLLGRIIAGNMPLDTGEVEIIQTDQARIQTDRPVHFQVDGEYCGEEQLLEISVWPKQIQIATSLSP